MTSVIATRVGRRNFLTRVGGVVAGTSAAWALSSGAKAAAASPVCCYGLPSCSSIGQSCSGCQNCCWYCCLNNVTYKCCDISNTCNGSYNCICAVRINNPSC